MINFTSLIILILFLVTSCNDLDDKQSHSGKIVTDARIKIDSSTWLKESRGIRDIIEDEEGNLWFSSPDYIAKYDGTVMYYFSENDGLSITGNFHKDNSGTIWVEDGFKAFRFNGKRFLEEQIDSITCANGLWIQRGLNPADTNFVEPGLYEVNQNFTKFHPFPIRKNINNKFLHLPTTKAFLEKDSTVWVGTMEKVYGYKNGSFISFGREEMGRQNDRRQMGIRGIYIDSRENLWIADNGAGVFMYNGSEIINFTKQQQLDEENTNGNRLNRVFSIAEDSQGKLWFGTVYSGIWNYDPKLEELINYASNDGVNSENIWTIYKTKKGELLFAGETPAAVYIFNGRKFIRKY